MSFIVYTFRKIRQKVIDRAWFQTVSPKPQTIQPEDKIFVMITFFFCCMLIVGVVIGLNVESKFHIFQFFGRFLLSVIIPSIVYVNNPDLRIFVKEMFW